MLSIALSMLPCFVQVNDVHNGDRLLLTGAFHFVQVTSFFLTEVTGCMPSVQCQCTEDCGEIDTVGYNRKVTYSLLNVQFS